MESFRSAYRRQLEEMAGLGKWEEGWKESIKASVLHGTEKFVAGMLKELKGDRRELRAAASKSVKTNDFKIGWWNGVSITTTVSVISEKGGRRLSAFDAVFDAVAGAFD